MYPLVAALLVSLAVAKLVDLVDYAVTIPRAVRLPLAFALGIGIAWSANWSMFYDWMIGFRYTWMNPIATGLVLGGLAALWHNMLSFVSSHAGHAAQKEPGARIRKAA